MAYTSLFKKDDVRVTQAFSTTHKGLDLSRGVIEQPIYLPNKAISGYVWKILPGYTSGGTYYANAPIIYVKHLDGSGSRYIHSYPRNVKVKVGDTVVAGQQVCSTGNAGHSTADHLHFEWLSKWDDLNTRVDPAPYVMNDNQATFKIGDRVTWTEIQNIRTGSGTNYQISGQTYIGQVATIKDGPRVADGYTWFDMQFDNDGTGWVAEVSKFKAYVFVPPVEPPQPSPCEEYIKQVQVLTEEKEQLKTDLDFANDRVKVVEGNLELRNTEIDELQKEADRLLEERNNFETQYLAVVTELNSLKDNRSWLEELLHKLFGSK